MMAIIQSFGVQKNKMEINYDKTTCMIVGTQHRKNILPLHICVDGNKIKDVKKQKLLGTCIYTDENLRWTDHIDHICAKYLIQNFTTEATFHIYPN